MQKKVSGLAEQLGVAAEIIAPKKELSAALEGNFDGRVFRGWRGDLIGTSLRAMLD